MAKKYLNGFVFLIFCWIHNISASNIAEDEKQNMVTYATFEALPDEMHQHILDHLDLQSIINYACVCQAFYGQWNSRSYKIDYDDQIPRSLPLNNEELHKFTKGRHYKKVYYHGFFDILDFTKHTFPLSKTYIKNHLNFLKVYLPLFKETQSKPQNFSQPICFTNTDNKETFVYLEEHYGSRILFELDKPEDQKKDFSLLLNFKNPFNLHYNYKLISQCYENLCFLIKNGLKAQSICVSYDFADSFLQNSILFSESLSYNPVLKNIIIEGYSIYDYVHTVIYDHDNSTITVNPRPQSNYSYKLLYQKLFNILQYDKIQRTFIIMDDYVLENRLQSNFDRWLYAFSCFQTGITNYKNLNINTILEILKTTDINFENSNINCPTEIVFFHNYFNDQNIKDIVYYLKFYKKLKNINFSNNRFKKDGLKAIGNLTGHLPKLEILTLKDNEINDDLILILIPYLIRNNTLTCLDLSNNQIDNTGASALYKMLEYKTSISELCLKGNPCDNSWLEKIYQLLILRKSK